MPRKILAGTAMLALVALVTYPASADDAPKDNKGLTTPKSQVIEDIPSRRHLIGERHDALAS